MKICWDNIEGIYLTKKGFFRKKQDTYIYKESCARCGGPYLTIKSKQSIFCGQSCAMSGKLVGEKHPMYGNKQCGIQNFNYKGGVTKINIPLYDTYAYQMLYAEEVHRDPENTDWLQVKCAYCGRWFTPKSINVQSRIKALNGTVLGEARLYCSENCKQACPIYYQKKWPKGFRHASSREVDPNLRQMVLERDDWTCQICSKTVEEAQLHCHHMDPVAQNLMFQNDMDSCITLCKDCHKEVHTQYGCRYVDLRCKETRV